MKKMFIIIAALVVLAGCTSTGSNEADSMRRSDGGMTNTGMRGRDNRELVERAIQMIEESDFDIELEEAARINNMTVEEYADLLIRHLEALEDERQMEWWGEEEKKRVDHVIRGFHIPAPLDKDWHEMERFVFYYVSGIDGEGFVLDRMHGRMYYDPQVGGLSLLEFFANSAEFTEQDFEGLISAFEASGLRDWAAEYIRDLPDDDFHDSPYGGWVIGILFSDGTIRRWRGRGMPDEQFAGGRFVILRDYIRAAGQDIITRHRAETE